MKKSDNRHKGLRNMGIALLIFATLIVIAAGIYIYRCTRYWQADYQKTLKSGFNEKQIVLEDGSIINYSEGPDNGKALLLIHGQSTAWEDYAGVLPELSKNWHVFAVDCYGHGESSRNPDKYSLKANGDDLIWFVNTIIGKETVVSGHSSGGLLASYIAVYGGELIVGAVLEDPPIFSTEPDYFEKSFAYHDSFKPIHNYLQSAQSECWEAYYLRNCLWGRLYAASSVGRLADHAQKLHERQPEKPIQFFYMPESINIIFLYMKSYDLLFGETFYDYSWHSNIRHSDLMTDLKIPSIFLHANEQYTEDGILLAASSNEQARKAVELIGDCELIELTSNHNIHRFNRNVFLGAINKMQS